MGMDGWVWRVIYKLILLWVVSEGHFATGYIASFLRGISISGLGHNGRQVEAEGNKRAKGKLAGGLGGRIYIPSSYGRSVGLGGERDTFLLHRCFRFSGNDEKKVNKANPFWVLPCLHRLAG
jgi:hypothetical protein